MYEKKSAKGWNKHMTSWDVFATLADKPTAVVTQVKAEDHPKIKSSEYTPTEAEEQRAVIVWAHQNIGRYPELKMLYAVPNGGYRSEATGAELKRQGTLAGVPDLTLPVARHGYHALYIEMKRVARGHVTPKQREMIIELRRLGNKAEVCAGAVAAIELLEWYLNGAETKGAADDTTEQ